MYLDLFTLFALAFGWHGARRRRRQKSSPGPKCTELHTRHEKGSQDTMSLQQAAPVIRGSESVLRSMAKAAANEERRLVAEARSGCSNAFGELSPPRLAW